MLEEIKNIRTGDIQIKSFGKAIAIILFVIAFLLFNKEIEYYKLVIYIGLFFVSCGFLVMVATILFKSLLDKIKPFDFCFAIAKIIPEKIPSNSPIFIFLDLRGIMD